MTEKYLNAWEEKVLAVEALKANKIPTDQYNSMDNPYIQEDYSREIQSPDTDWQPKKGELISSYYHKLEIYAQINAKKNIQSHILGPKKAWWTHRNPSGCFMCQDTNLIATMLHVIRILSEKYPKGKL